MKTLVLLALLLLQDPFPNPFSQPPVPLATLTVTTSGSGSGTVTGTGISCGSDCSQVFNRGVSVTLTATASSGSFTGWSGACTGTGTCVVTMAGAKNVVATFTSSSGGTNSRPYFMSAENGCGTDPNVILCEDFEHDGNGNTPGSWYEVVNCANTNVLNKGWCGDVNTISPAKAVRCGAGITPFGNCAGDGGFKTGFDQNNANHHFKTATCGSDGSQLCQVNEIYVRWYAKWDSGYVFGGEKHLNVTNDDGDIAFVNVQLNCGTSGTSSNATAYIQNLHGIDTCRTTNFTINSGVWYFFELHVRAGSSGLAELWINDCGAAGTSCGAAPVLRATLSGNLPGNANGSQIETVWLENWSNPASVGTGPLWDQLKVSRVGPIGFAP